jgi:hypothetical protein
MRHLAAVAGVGALVLPLAWSTTVAAATTSFVSPTSFASVSCTSPGNCIAVGSLGMQQLGVDRHPTVEPVYATETLGVWGRAVELHSPGGSAGEFTSVSCPSLGNCTAVGYDYSGGFNQHGGAEVGHPIYATETAGEWVVPNEITDAVGNPYITGDDGDGFTSVSCSAATACTAVGGGIAGGAAIYATESGGTWGPATFVNTPTTGGLFEGVSCTDATDCTAVGYDVVPDSFGLYDQNAPIVVGESSGTWGTASELAPDAASGFSSVSCTAAASCTAIGESSAPPFGPVVVTESAGAWGTVSAIPVAEGMGAILRAISCASATACTAAGVTFGISFGTVGAESILVSSTAGVWGPARAAGGGGFNGISCPSATGCTAVGSLHLCVVAAACKGSRTYPLDVTEAAGAWPAAPGAPRLRTGKAVNHGVKVSWSAPTSNGGSAIEAYAAIASIVLDGTTREYVCTSTHTSCTILGLTNGRMYTLSAYARSAAGTSFPSSIRTVRPRA